MQPRGIGVLVLVLTCGCGPASRIRDVFRQPSPYEQYVAALREARLDQTGLGAEWIAAGEKGAGRTPLHHAPSPRSGVPAPLRAVSTGVWTRSAARRALSPRHRSSQRRASDAVRRSIPRGRTRNAATDRESEAWRSPPGVRAGRGQHVHSAASARAASRRSRHADAACSGRTHVSCSGTWPIEYPQLLRCGPSER